jgi:Cadherin-like/Bacterial cadherin-like domain
MTLLNWFHNARQSRKSVPPTRYRDAFQADLFVCRLEERRVLSDPAGADATLNVLEDATITFQQANFGFSDADSDTFDAVKISSLPGTGSLLLDGNPVAQNDFITVTDIDANKLTFVPVMDANGTPYTSFTFQVRDSANELDQTANTITINVAAVNDEPTLTATGQNPTFTEGGAAAALYSGTSISTVESGQELDRVVLTVTNVTDSGAEFLHVNGVDIDLTADATDVSAGMIGGDPITVDVSLSGTTSTVTIKNNLGLSETETESLVDGLAYQNTSQDPTAAMRVVTLTQLRDTGLGTAPDDNLNDALAVTSTVTVVGINDEPTLTATGQDPTFTEGDAAATLYSGTSVSTVEAGQELDRLVLTVTNVTDSGAEFLQVNGVNIDLTTSATDVAAGTIGGDAITVDVGLVGTTSTVTIKNDSGLSEAETEALVDGLAYENQDQLPTEAVRVVTLTQLRDTGLGTAPDDNLNDTLAVTSMVTVVAANSEPTLTSTGQNPTFTEGDVAAALYSGTSVSTVEAGQELDRVVLTVTNVTDTGFEFLQVNGANIDLTTSATDVAAGTIGGDAITVDVSLVGTTATLTIKNDLGLSETETETLVDGLAYQNTSEDPTAAMRVVTLTQLRDTSLGTAPDDNLNDALAVASTVTVVVVNDPPAIGTNTGATVAEGGTVTITMAMLNENDPDDSGIGLTYTVTSGPTNGFLQLSTNAGMAITSFTQADVNNGLVQYKHDGSETTSDSFDFSLADGGEDAAMPATGTFNITVTPVNDAPIVTAPAMALNVQEKANLAIEGTGFSVTDSDEAGGGASAMLSVTEGDITVVVGNSGVMISGQNGKSTVTITGTIAQINSLLTGTSTGTITYVDTKKNPNTPVTFTVTVNDLGNTGADPGLTGNATSEQGANTATINIAEINDAPVVTAPAMDLNAIEQTNLTVSATGFSVTDDAGNNDVEQATLTVGEGILTLNTGSTGLVVSGDGTGTVTVTGKLSDIDNLLTGSGMLSITYFNNSDTPSASTTLTVTVNDMGHTGTDPGLTGDAMSEEGSNSVTINIAAVNDAPLVTAPGAPLAATEQTNLAIQGAGFTVTEVDEAGGMATATLSVTQGNITVDAGDSGVTMISNNGTGTVTFDGTIAQINSLLTGMSTGTITYNNPLDAPAGSVTFTVTVNDQGNTGMDPGLTGDAMSEEGTASVAINITAVNDGPVVTAPGAPLAVNEGVNLNVHGTGFSVTDADEAGAGATATLSVTEGTITVTAGNSGVTMISGNGTGTVTFNGTIAQINSLLDGTSTGTIVYRDDVDAPSTSATFTVTVNDQGHTGMDPGLTGDGMSEEDSKEVTINITPINDAPVVTPPGAALAATEQTNLSIHGMGFSVTDPDEAGNGATATLSVTAGTITVSAGNSGVMVNSGNGTGSVTISGTVAQINNLLTGAGTGTIVYFNNSDTPPASVTFTVTVNDQGHNGIDPGLTGDATSEEGMASITINITAVNDPPIVGAPGAPLPATEQTDLNIHGQGFTVTEVDEAGGTATATLSVGEGMITITPGDSGVMVVGNNVGATVTVTGTIAQINNLLTGAGTGTIVYNDPLDAPSASTTLTVTVNDQGHTGVDPGPGGTADNMSEEASASVTINVANVNDPPTANDVNVMITEDDFPATFDFDANDVDADDDPTTLVYTVSAPTIMKPISPAFDVSIDQPAPGQFRISDPMGTFQQLAEGESATITFTYFATDMGGLTSSPPLATVTITVMGVNDAPEIRMLQGPTSVDEASIATYKGQVFDVDFSDAAVLTLHVNWNDVDNAQQDVAVDPVTGAFSVDHVFPDDFPGATPDVATVQFVGADNHEAVATVDLPVNVRNLPPQFSQQPVATEITTTNGKTTVTFRVSDPSLRDTPLTVVIDWNDPFADVNDQTTTLPPIDWVNDNGVKSAEHNYVSSPDPEDPAKVRVTLSVTDDDMGTTVQEILVPVTGAGLSSPAVDVAPETPTLSFELPTVVSVPLAVQSTVEVIQVIQFRTGQTGQSLGANEQLVLQAMTPDGQEKGEEIVLGEQDERWEAVLQRLPEIFNKSTDDHYRIYLKREDGTRRLVLNVVLRRHKQIDAEEVKQGKSPAAKDADAATKKKQAAAKNSGRDPGEQAPPKLQPPNGPADADAPVVAPKPGKNAEPPPPRPMTGAGHIPGISDNPWDGEAGRRPPASVAVAAVAGWTGLEGLRRWRRQVDDEMARWADAGFMERKRRLSRMQRTRRRKPIP